MAGGRFGGSSGPVGAVPLSAAPAGAGAAGERQRPCPVVTGPAAAACLPGAGCSEARELPVSEALGGLAGLGGRLPGVALEPQR